MKLASESNGRWDATLNNLTALLLPAIDRLTDAISTGYWKALVDQSEEMLERLSYLLENSPYGVYEADIDGLVQYANPALAHLVGRPDQQLIGLPLSEVFRAIHGPVSQLLAEPAEGIGQVSLLIPGVNSDAEIAIDTVVRRVNEAAVGFGGIARLVPETTPTNFEPLARHTFELQRSLTILKDAGLFIVTHAEEMSLAKCAKRASQCRNKPTDSWPSSKNSKTTVTLSQHPNQIPFDVMHLCVR